MTPSWEAAGIGCPVEMSLILSSTGIKLAERMWSRSTNEVEVYTLLEVGLFIPKPLLQVESRFIFFSWGQKWDPNVDVLEHIWAKSYILAALFPASHSDNSRFVAHEARSVFTPPLVHVPCKTCHQAELPALLSTRRLTGEINPPERRAYGLASYWSRFPKSVFTGCTFSRARSSAN